MISGQKKELEALAQENQKEARRQYAKRQQEKFQRLKECSLDKDNQKRYADRQKEWENISNRYKYPINEDVFESFVIPRNDGKNTDVQRPRNIIKKLKENQTGKDAYNHIKKKNIPIYILYNVDNPRRLCGEYDPIDKCIYVYADKTKTILESTKQLFMKLCTINWGIMEQEKKKFIFFLEEAKYEGIKLTPEVIKGIIKAVNNSAVYMKNFLGGDMSGR